MFELFRNEPNLEVGVIQPPEWPFIKRGFQKNIAKVMTYHRMYPKPVKSNHILIRLLHTLGIPKRLPLERYYAGVDNVGLKVATVMKMTSTVNKGKFHKGVFYGPDCPEVLIAVDDYFDFEEADRNWRNVCAVTPLLHPKSDLDIHLANGESYSAENGLAIIMINVPMLAVQFRAFWNEQRRKIDQSSTKTISQFIAGYVIPNMLPKQMDICLMNRLRNRYNKFDDSKNISFRSHSFVLSDYNRYIDVALGKTLININRSSKKFNVILHQIPSFYNDNVFKALMLPDIAPTLQVTWAMVLARLKEINFLFDISEEHLSSRNQSDINQILRTFRLNNTYYMLQTMLPSEVYDEAQFYIDNILKSINRNTF